MAEQQEPRELVELERAEAVRLMRAGAEAQRAGELVTTCPHSPAGDATERVKAAAWVRGFVRARNEG